MSDLLLIADIGGTNTRIGLADSSGLLTDSLMRFRNAEVSSFEDVLGHYLAEVKPGALRGACAGAAGPVDRGVATLTNLSWTIDRNAMRAATGAEVADVINDLPAQGLALDALPEENLLTLKEGLVSEGPRLVVGLGTGFNIVPVHRVGDVLLAPSCEAGHATLPHCKDQAALCEWLKNECGYPSMEVALAGMGIENIYRFHSGLAVTAQEVMGLVEAGDAHAVATIADYVALLGAVVGDYALSHLPFGGIYLTGGVSRAVAPYLEPNGFAGVMADKGRFSDLAGRFAVTLIQDDYAALKGCAQHLRQLIASCAT